MPKFGQWADPVDFQLACRRNVIGEALAKSARKFPQKTALIDSQRDKRFTFQELNNRVNSLANALTDVGVRKGDKVAFVFYNSHEIIECYFAIAKLGAIVVPLNFRFAPHEVEYAVNHSDAIALILGEDFVDLVNAARPNLKMVKHYICAEEKVPKDMVSYEELLAKYPSDEPQILVEPDDESNIMYTAGTTGPPKGCIMTHANYMWAALANLLLLSQIGWSPRDRYLNITPIFHGGSWDISLACLWNGNTIAVLRAFAPVKVLEVIEKERINFTWMAAPMYSALLQVPDIDKYDLSSLRGVASAAAPLPTAVRKRFEELFPHVIMQDWLGQTELSCTVLALSHPEDVKRKVRCVGLPVLGMEAKIVDDEGNEVPIGKEGELVVRSPSLMQGYYKEPQKTIEAFEGDWFHTGDVAKQDEEGYFYLVDRKKDLIITGGENVAPTEVEGVIAQHPKVAEVTVIGVPDEKWGEAVKALVIPKRGETVTEEEIIEFCRDELTGFKRPKSVDFVEDFPRSSVGKILKREIREKYRREAIAR